jgi:hypothetical protein
LGDHPELAIGMVNEGYGLTCGGCNGPTATEEINLVVCVDAAAAVQRQMEIKQAGGGTGLQDRALFGQGFGAGVVGGQAGGAADGAVLAGQFGGEQLLSLAVIGDFIEGQQGDEAFLKGAKAAFDFAFGLGAGGDQMRDAQRGEGALEFGTGVAPLGGGIMPEQGQAVGVKRQRQAMADEAKPEVLEMVPSGVGGHKGASHEFAGMIIHGQQEGLLVVRRPPLVDGGVVLPEFTQAGAFPAATRLGDGWGGLHEEREVVTGIGGDGFAIPPEREAGGQFIRDELIVGRSLERQEGLQKLPDLGWPIRTMVATRDVEGKGGRMLQPGGAQPEEVCATDGQKFGGRIRIKFAPIISVEGLVEKRNG